MKQQHFEEYIFSDEPLTSKEQQLLEEYLQDRPEGIALLESWRAVNPLLVEAEMLEPSEGFARRWQARWQKSVKRKKRAEAYWIMLGSVSGALALLAIVWQNSSPILLALKQLLFNALEETIQIFSFLQVVVRLSSSLLGKLPPSWWASIAGLIVLLPLFWYAIYKDVFIVKGVTK